MSLGERKLIILKSIIDDYILTAVPIGSRTIARRVELGLSSATIRNEMSDLEEMGYLDQPHTSAGRIPSEKAYRLYVDELMRHTPLTQEEARKLRRHISKRMDAAEELLAQTAQVLSEVTDYTSIVTAPNLGVITLKHIQLVPVSEGKALVVVVTDAGVVNDVVVSIPEDIGADELEKFSRIMTARLKGRTLADAVGYLTNANVEKAQHRGFLEDVAEAVSREAQHGSEKIVLSGAMNLLKHPEYSDVNKARSMLEVLETKGSLLRILQKAKTMGFTVTIGTENELDELKDSSIVTVTYRVGETPLGSVGVIGPTRMDYSRVMAVLSYMGRNLSEMFSAMQDAPDRDEYLDEKNVKAE